MKEIKTTKKNVKENPFKGEIRFEKIAEEKEVIMDNGRIRLK